jgi:phenylalanyl-tRNA synthetase beta chain
LKISATYGRTIYASWSNSKMNIILSWIKEFVDIDLSLPELAHKLTLAGLEVKEIRVVGLPLPEYGHNEFNIHGICWEAEKIVIASVSEVMPHPNADRLVLCNLYDGEREHIVLTGAPNLFPYKGLGKLEKPLKVAYAREGARIYDGHQEGQVLTTLKRAKIRGVESYSMICSEKELGISEEHEGVIILDEDAPTGAPLADYMGDAVLDVEIIPNIARAASILGVAREIAALTQKPLREPTFQTLAQGAPTQGRAAIDIREPELNPRFVLGLIENVSVKPSPYQVQRRLRLAGMRPINNIVDATNYAMLEIGEPLHAFDYDILVQRAGGKSPTIITRSARAGERLTTLDGEDRRLDDFTVLVCDTAGALSIAGVMGGAESEVNAKTRNVLLEGASWNLINIRRTLASQRISSEAAYRFSRGVHPAMAARGVQRCLEWLRQWSGGIVAQGLIDAYPLPPQTPTVVITSQDAQRLLGIQLTGEEIADYLQRLQFSVQVNGDQVSAQPPDHRLDIGEGVIGKADVLEEIARLYGYDRIPETLLATALPPQGGDQAILKEESVRDLLVGLGLQEVATYRLTSADREARRFPPDAPPDDKPYITLANPIAIDRNVLRHSLLSSLFEVVERNARMRERIAIFEVGPEFIGGEGALPDEFLRLGIVLTGPRTLPGWKASDREAMDFYDLKGLIEALLEGLHIRNSSYEPWKYPVFHPGKCARVVVADSQLGVIGELHPQVREGYDMPPTPILAAWFDMDALLQAIPEQHFVKPAPAYPPVFEDLAVIVAEDTPAAHVAELIQQAGGKVVQVVRLFDLYRSAQIGAGKKSLAYRITYQAQDRTLTDKDVAAIRSRIVRRLEQELGARLRSS